MGDHRKPILEPYRAFIVERIPHLALHRPKEELAGHGVKVSRNAVREFLRHEGCA